VKVTWNWLNDWVDLTGSPEELAQLLATRGLPVESVERGVTFDPAIVVGLVVEKGQHPNADRLSLCSVDIGGPARLSIVCGAPNVAAGQKVAVAQIGSRLPDGTKLRKRITASNPRMRPPERSRLTTSPGHPVLRAIRPSAFRSHRSVG
jgi:phenylalanyl-tRNA synthetase beta chain